MSFEVELRNLTYTLEECSLFSEFNLTIQAGSTLAITGASGSGKSKLVELIGGVLKPTSGEVIWEDTNIFKCSRATRKILEMNSSVVFQEHALIIYLPLFENVALPLRHHKIGTKEEIDTKVTALLSRLNLMSEAWNLPEVLAEGARRLGSISRALINSPQLLCLDEPTEGLDEVQRKLFLEFFKEFQESRDTTIVVATNDEELLSLAGANTLHLGMNDEHQSQ